MTRPRQLSPLFLALIFGAMPLFAQPEPGDASRSPAEGTAPTTNQTSTPPQAPADTEPTQKSSPATTRGDSPFDYRSSEEISEDVPVSFPVDI
jgi:hypothetical protein